MWYYIVLKKSQRWRKCWCWLSWNPNNNPGFPFVKAELFSTARKTYSPAKHGKGRASEDAKQPCKSAHRKEACSSPKASAKLALMKAKEESSYNQPELLAARRKERATEPKGEKTTPKKTKVSPTKREVGTLWNVCNSGTNGSSGGLFIMFLRCYKKIIWSWGV